MSGNESVLQYVTKIQNLVSQMKDVGEEISERDIMAKILGTIPSRYNALVTAWDSVPSASQTVGILLERLIKEEATMAQDDETTSVFAAMNIDKNRKHGDAASSSHKGGKGGIHPEKKSLSGIKCFFCKKNGTLCAQLQKEETRA